MLTVKIQHWKHKAVFFCKLFDAKFAWNYNNGVNLFLNSSIKDAASSIHDL